MAKAQKKKYKSLGDIIGQLDTKFSDPIKEKYQELKNIYQGKDKKGEKKKGLHRIKNRYQAAEEYMQGLEKEGLTEGEKIYLYNLATEFTKYDYKLDKKRKENSEYKKQVSEKRNQHTVNTLDYIVRNTPTVEKMVYKQPENLETYVNKEEKPDGKRINPSFDQTRKPVEYRDGITPIPAKPLRPSRRPINVARSAPVQESPGLLRKIRQGINKHRYTMIGGLATALLAGWIWYSGMFKVTLNKGPENPGKKDYIANVEKGPGAGKGGWESNYQEKQTPVKPIIKPAPQKPKPVIPKQVKPKVINPEIKNELREYFKSRIAPKLEVKDYDTKTITEKSLTDLILNGGLDFSKYDFSFSGTGNDPGAVVFYEKGNDKVMFNRALGGEIWEKIGSLDKLRELVNAMKDYNDRHFNFPLRAEFIKNRYGQNVGFSFTDFPHLMVQKHKDGSVMVHNPERGMIGGGDGAGTSGTGPSGGVNGEGGSK